MWTDQSSVVDCSKPHSLETVAVIKPAVKLTRALVNQLAGSCASSEGLGYLGIDSPAIRTTAFPLVYWPSPAQRAAGQNWLRCDVGVRATTGCCHQLAPQTGSLHGAVSSDPTRFLVCTDQVPDPTRNQPVTSCQKPHRAELLATTLQLAGTHYPSAATLSKQGQSGCAQLLAHRKDLASLVITPFWQSKAETSGGSPIGFCWIHRKAGLLPPIE